jgi:signal transduction histidine kinase
VRNLTKTILEEAGYTVLEAVDGEDAIKVFAEHQDAVQLVLLDVIMPKKNGKEVHNWIKSARPDTRVLFMSGYSADIIFKKGVLEEGLNLISKPAAPHDLLRKVREVLDAKRGHETEAVPLMQKSVAASLSPGERVVQEAEAPRLRGDKPDARAGHAGSILLVDDDPNVLAYVSHLLEEHGYATHPCGSAREALRALKDIRADVVLTDIVMPGTSGIELLETVHGIDPELPVILLTAYADLEKAVESIKKGAFDFIMKPYDPEQLLRSLEKAVRYSRLVRLEMEYQDRLEEFNTEIDTLVAERTMSLMALTVADSVRNPATVIALSCKKIMEKGVPEELGKYVAFIRDEAGKLETIVKNFQNLLKSKRSVFAYEDLNEVVRNVISLVEKESALKGIKLVQRLSEGPLRMNMQKNLLRVAVQHVLRNAVEATPLGGEVTVTSAFEDDKVVLTLADTGSGISEQDAGKIFDPFYSTKEHRYGMGLPLVKQIVSEHLGEIELSTVPGKGTTFRMIFPSRWQEK